MIMYTRNKKNGPIDNEESGLFYKSALVVAHPDDEILWFSSIFQKVDKIIICYLDIPSQTVWSEGRRKSILQYPTNNLVSLKITESETLNAAGWPVPSITEQGLAIETQHSNKTYESNFLELTEKLAEQLRGYHNIFTHNPWGEYGHEEHVQVFRAVKHHQVINKFNVWVSNYVSNKSLLFMHNQLNNIENTYVTLPTQTTDAKKIMDIYKEN
ncbi:unnamed protein product, partial [marine sediment metagenome]